MSPLVISRRSRRRKAWTSAPGTSDGSAPVRPSSTLQVSPATRAYGCWPSLPRRTCRLHVREQTLGCYCAGWRGAAQQLSTQTPDTRTYRSAWSSEQPSAPTVVLFGGAPSLRRRRGRRGRRWPARLGSALGLPRANLRSLPRAPLDARAAWSRSPLTRPIFRSCSSTLGVARGRLVERRCCRVGARRVP